VTQITLLKSGFCKDWVGSRPREPGPDLFRPYKGWIKLGRVVRKGERSAFGLFHIDQTDVIPAKPAPAPKGKLFGKAKAKPHVVA
jgi:hypothetical protein